MVIIITVDMFLPMCLGETYFAAHISMPKYTYITFLFHFCMVATLFHCFYHMFHGFKYFFHIYVIQIVKMPANL